MVVWSIVAVVVVVALLALAWWSSGRARKPVPTLDKEQVQADVIGKTGPPRNMPHR